MAWFMSPSSRSPWIVRLAKKIFSFGWEFKKIIDSFVKIFSTLNLRFIGDSMNFHLILKSKFLTIGVSQVWFIHHNFGLSFLAFHHLIKITHGFRPWAWEELDWVLRTQSLGGWLLLGSPLELSENAKVTVHFSKLEVKF